VCESLLLLPLPPPLPLTPLLLVPPVLVTMSGGRVRSNRHTLHVIESTNFEIHNFIQISFQIHSTPQFNA